MKLTDKEISVLAKIKFCCYAHAVFRIGNIIFKKVLELYAGQKFEACRAA